MGDCSNTLFSVWGISNWSLSFIGFLFSSLHFCTPMQLSCNHASSQYPWFEINFFHDHKIYSVHYKATLCRNCPLCRPTFHKKGEDHIIWTKIVQKNVQENGEFRKFPHKKCWYLVEFVSFCALKHINCKNIEGACACLPGLNPFSSD